MTELIERLQAELLADRLPAFLVTPDRLGEMGSRTGAYLLALHLPRIVNLQAIDRSPQSIGPGRYVYAGSAYGPGGINARLRRHLKPAKAVHWHIDRLTTKADDMAALAVPDGHECHLVEALLRSRRFGIAVPGFGSSDCRTCEGHLLAASGARACEAGRHVGRQQIEPRFRAG